ncbi:MAG TPA: 2-oxo-4-hydroxy-4-carboxy-5-ureidoimidazoline decarboxylase [Candidatus Limnocylindria bacterium]|nr:2-oxo-4-hydroxy-4-carboxy-5-ureidoimidazoline decarboxylase [Candidatus Limnocylindria bacterium]
MAETRTARFQTVGKLNEVSVPRFMEAVAMLFEPAPRFGAWLAAARPFASDDDLMKAAARIAHRMAEADQLELINAHPRLGARGGLSDASRREQGLAADAVDRELARLNAAYEKRFGFRYVVYVAGRSREALIPEFQAALARERSSELSRALDDTLAIAASRLHYLRSTPGGPS